MSDYVIYASNDATTSYTHASKSDLFLKNVTKELKEVEHETHKGRWKIIHDQTNPSRMTGFL